MAYRIPDYQLGKWVLQGDQSGGDTVQESYQPPEPLTHNVYQASRCAVGFLGRSGDGDRFPQGQAAPTS